MVEHDDVKDKEEKKSTDGTFFRRPRKPFLWEREKKKMSRHRW